jgi:hypothetical protein
MIDKPKGRVQLYACGGAGVNIGKQFEQFRGVDEVGCATMDVVYIDASRANISETVPEKYCYLLKGVDGSGKIRRENYQAIADHTREILQLHEPKDLSIVISSGSGGSGSVIAPSLVSELLDRGEQVIVVLIGSTDTKLDIDNTLKTLKSYDAIVKKHNKPVVMAYLENNSRTTPRAAVDQAVHRMISSLSYLYSRQNEELDSRDLHNWINFNITTAYAPQVAALSIYEAEVPEEVRGSVISAATLASTGEDTYLGFTPDYQCVGFKPHGVSKGLQEIPQLHFVTTNNVAAQAASGLNAKLEELAKAQRARVSAGAILTDKDDVTDNGLVL